MKIESYHHPWLCQTWPHATHSQHQDELFPVTPWTKQWFTVTVIINISASTHLIDKFAKRGESSKLFADPHSIKTGLLLPWTELRPGEWVERIKLFVRFEWTCPDRFYFNFGDFKPDNLANSLRNFAQKFILYGRKLRISQIHFVLKFPLII